MSFKKRHIIYYNFKFVMIMLQNLMLTFHIFPTECVTHL